MCLALERRALRAWLPWGHVRGVPVLRGSWDRRHGPVPAVALGFFKLVRDEDDAAVGEDGKDLREKEFDKQGEIRKVMFEASGDEAGSDERANKERNGNEGEKGD